MKRIYLLIFLCCLGFGSFAASRISTIGTATVAPVGICTGAGTEIFALTNAQSTTATTTNAFKFVTTGTYTATDITSFSLYRNSTNTLTGATFVGSVTATAAGTQTISYATLTMTASTTFYYMVVANVAAGATVGNTVAVNAITGAAGTPFTFTGTAPSYAGTAAASGTFTITASPAAITAVTTFSVCAGSGITLNDATASGTWSSGSPTLATVDGSGNVTGIGAGSPVISYTQGGCSARATVTVGALASGIAGATAVCTGLTTTLSVTPTTATGGTWSTSDGTTASISATGVVRGVAAGGPVTISYTTPGCAAVTTPFTVNIQPSSITGGAYVCAPGTNTLTATPAGGTWTSSTTTFASIDPSSGILQYISNGNTNITYTLSDNCFSTLAITAAQVPTPISGTTSFCGPITTTLLSQNFNSGMTGQVGGIWTVTNTGAAGDNWAITTPPGYTAEDDPSVPGDGSVYMDASANASGEVTITTQLTSPSFSTVGMSSGKLALNGYMETDGDVATIDYSLNGTTWTNIYNYESSGSSQNQTWVAGTPNQTFNLPAGALGQPTVYLRWYYSSDFGWLWIVDNIVVTGTTSSGTTLTDGVAGGTWMSGTTSVATIGSTSGALTGLTPGITTITYTNVCGAPTYIDTVIGAPAAITGTSLPIAINSTTTFSDVATNGTWSSSDPTIASVVPATGVITGVAAGTATITYSNGCSTATTKTITVAPQALTVTPTAINMGPSPVGVAATVQSYTLSGTYLTGFPNNITLTSSNADYEISLDGSTWVPFGSNLLVPFTSSTLAPTPIYVLFTPSSLGTSTATVTSSGGGVSAPPTELLSGAGASPCAVPGIPTLMTFAGTNTTGTNVSFTPAGTPDGYVLVESTTAFSGAPVAGHTYTVGESLGDGMVVATSYTTAPTYSVTGLTGNTQYYFTVIPYYGGVFGTCTGGPVYPTGTQLTDSVITCPAAPGSPTASSITASSVVINWTAPVGGSASTLNYSIDVSTSNTFATVIAGSPFNAGTGLSYTVSGIPAGVTLYYRISATGACTGTPSATGNFASGSSYSFVTISSGLNQDVIADGTSTSLPISSQTLGTAAFDHQGYGYVAYNYAYTPGGYTASDGSFPSSNVVNSLLTPGLSWKIASYTGNNCDYMLIPAAGTITSTITLTNPVYAAKVYVLASTVIAAGTTSLSVTLNYADGTSSAPTNWGTIYNWFTNTNAAVEGEGRINVTNGQPSGTVGGAPYLVQDAITNTYTVSPVSSISFVATGNTNNVVGVFGVSIQDGVLNTSIDEVPDFGTVAANCTSAAQSFTMYGSQLYPASGNITASAPAGFQISSDGTTWDTTVTFAYTGGTMPNTTVYVRFAPTTTGVISGNISFAGGALNDIPYVAVSGTGSGGIVIAPATTAAFGPVTEFTTSSPITYTVSGTELTAGTMTVTSTNPDFLVSPDGLSDWSSSYTFTYGTSASATIYVEYTPTLVGTETSSISVNGSTIACPPPSIIATGSGSNTCLAPDLPTALVINSVTATSASVGFTATGGANGYLLVQSATPFSGTPVTATTYNVGDALGNGTVIASSYTTAPTYPLTGLTDNTIYYFTVIPFNGGLGGTCSGGPLYPTGTQLTGSVTTCPSAPVINTVTPTLTSLTINWGSVAGGDALPVTYTINVSSTSDFLTPVTGSPFTVTDPTVSLDVTGLLGATTYYYEIKATTSACTSAYVGGSQSTSGYCTPTFSGGAGGCFDYYTQNVTFAGTTWNGTSGNCGTSNYTATVFTVTAGVAGPIAITNTSYAGAAAWVDFSNDGNFDDPRDGIFLPAYSGAETPTYSGSVTVPTTVATGYYRMRVITNWATAWTTWTVGAAQGPCSAYSTEGYGNFQDFTIYVINPVLTASTATLTDFGVIPTCSNSSVQTFSVSGTGLYPSAGNIVATAPAGGFEISADGTTWGTTATYAYTGGTLSGTVYVQFAPTVVGTASGNITFTGGTVAAPPSVSVSATAAGITITPTSTAFFGPVAIATTSSAIVYTVTGSNLTAGTTTVTTSNPDFEISPTGGSGTYSTSNYTFANGVTLPATTVYVVFSPTVVSTETATITVTSPTGCVQTIIATGSGAVSCGAPGTPTGISFTGTNDTGANITFTPSGSPDGYLVIESTSAFSGTPVTGTVYTVGSSIGTGTVVGVYTVNTLPLTMASSAAAPVIPNTAYNVTVIPFNGGPEGTCLGGPVFAASYLGGTYTTCPAAPIAVTSSGVTGNNFTLGWTAPAEGTADAITYGIDVSTDNTFATGVSSYTTSALTYTVTVPYGTTTYYYRVYAITAACNSSYSNTGNITTSCGITPLPYTEGFEGITTNNQLPTCMTATDLAASTFTWLGAQGFANLEPHTGNNYASFSGYNQSTFNNTNDWFFTPEFNFIAGYTYQVSFWYITDGDEFDEFTLQAAYGANNNSASMTNTFAGLTNVNTATYTQYTATFTATATGTNYVGIHCTDDDFDEYLTLDDISVKILPSLIATPAAVSVGSVNVGYSGVGSYSLSGIGLSGTGNIAITAPTGFQVSTLPTSGFATSINVPYTGPILTSTIIYVQFSPTVTGVTSGTITCTGGGATANVPVNGVGVNPTLVATPMVLNMGPSLVGVAAPVQSFTMSGTFLTGYPGDIALTSTNGDYQISTDGTTWHSTLSIPFTSGTLSAEPIYVQFTPSVLGTDPGTVTLSGGAAPLITVILNGTGANSCTAPAGVPTSMTFSGTNATSTNVGFTTAGTPDGYLLVRSSAALTGSAVTMHNYNIGDALGGGTVIGIYSTTPSYAVSGLTGNTLYYFTVIPFNGGVTGTCGSGPLYGTSLSAPVITCPATPASVSSSAVTSSGFNLSWSSSLGGAAVAITYSVDVSTNNTFTAPVTGSPFVVSDPVTTLIVSGLSTTTYYYRVTAAGAGTCNSSATGTASVTTTQYDYNAVPLAGFNEDIIANGTVSPANGVLGIAGTSTGIYSGFDGAGWAYVSADYNYSGNTPVTGHSLPVSGALSSAATAGLPYQLAGYSTNNALVLPATAVNTGTLTFTTPQYASQIYVLGGTGSGGTPGSNSVFTVHYADGSIQTSGTINYPDWYGTTPTPAVAAIGRVNVTGYNTEGLTTGPNLYEKTLALTNLNSKVLSVVISTLATGNGYLGINAISARTGVLYSSVSSLASFGSSTLCGPSSAQSFTINGSSLFPATTGTVSATASAGFQVSSDGIVWGATAVYTVSATNTLAGTVHVRFTPVAVGANTGTITFVGAGINNAPVITVSGTGVNGSVAGVTTVCQNSTTTLTDATGGTWTSSNASVASVDPISGIVTGISGGTSVISYTYGCVDTVNTATVTVNAAPSTFNVTGTGAYCAGGTGVAIGLDNSQSGVTYQLYNGVTAIGSAVTGTGSALSFGTYTAAATYTVAATNTTSGCASGMTGNATITINPLPVVYSVTGTGGYCAGDVTGVTVGLNNSDLGINYQLYNGSTAVGTAVTGAGSAISFGSFTTAATYTVVATNASTGCTNNMAGSATITINPLPIAYNVTGTGSYCTGGTGVAIGLDNSDNGVNYQLYDGATAVGTAVAGTGSAISFGSYTTAATYTVVATNTATGCTNAMTGGATITINALPVAYNVTGGGITCSGSGFAVGLDNSDLGVNYQLYNGATAVGTAVAGTGSAISFGTFTATATYTVLATNTSGCTNTMTGSAVIIINSLPTAYNVTGTGSYCVGGTGVTIGLDNSDNGVNYQLYDGATAVGTAVAGTGSAISFGSFTAAATYTILATNAAAGCTSAMTGSATITINPAPVVYNVTGSGSYCAGGTGLAVGLDNSDLDVYYQLYDGTTAVGSPVAGTGSAISFGTYTAATTYTVVGANGTTGCSSNMAGGATIVINAAVTPALTIAASATTVCAGTTVTLTPTPVNGGTTPTYKWFVNGVQTATSATYSYTPATGDNVYAILTSNVPCPVVDTAISDTVTITVNPIVAVSVSVTATADTVCAGTSVTFTATSVGGGTSPIYQWQVNGVDAGTGTTYTYIPVNGDSVTNVLSSSATCATPASAVSDTIIMVVNPIVTPSVTIASSSATDTVCAGTVVSYTATAASGGTTPVYQWQVNGAIVSTGNSYSYAPANGDTIIATLTSNAPCATSVTAVDTMIMVVNPLLVPTVTLTSAPGDTVCAGTLVTLTATDTLGGTAPSYQWYVGTTSVGSGSSYSYTPANGDSVSVILTSNAVCATPDTATASAIITVNTVTTPTVTITAVPGLSITSGESDALTATVAGGGSVPTYQWYVNGVLISGATSATYTSTTFVDLDSVTCVVTNTDLCGSAGNSSVIILVNVGVQQVTLSGIDVQLIPNPNTGTFTVKGTLGTTLDASVTMEITDMLGQVVYHNDVLAQKGIIDEKIQLSNTIASGMYLLTLHSGSNNAVFHFVLKQ